MTAKPAAKKPAAKKPAAKKPAAKKPAAKKPAQMTTENQKPVSKKVEKQIDSAAGMVLYTIRMPVEVVENIKAAGVKQGITHAAVARQALVNAFS